MPSGIDNMLNRLFNNAAAERAAMAENANQFNASPQYTKGNPPPNPVGTHTYDTKGYSIATGPVTSKPAPAPYKEGYYIQETPPPPPFDAWAMFLAMNRGLTPPGEIPTPQSFYEWYFKQKGWDYYANLAYGDYDPEKSVIPTEEQRAAGIQNRQLYESRLNEAQAAYDRYFGKGSRVMQTVGNVGEFVFEPLRLISPRKRDWSTENTVFTALDIASFGILGKVGKVIKFATKTDKALKALKADDLIKDVAGTVWKVTDASDPSLLKVVNESGTKASIGRNTVSEIGKFVDEAEEVAETVAKAEPDDVLAKLKNSWDESYQTVKKVSNKPGIATRIEEGVLDKFAGINKMTARVKKAFNGKLPQELNAELAAALIAGVPDSAKQIAKDTYKAMRDVAGDISDDLIDSYLTLRHNQDVLKMHPGRKVTGGLTSDELTRGINQLKTQLGDSYKKLEEASEVIRKHYDTLLEKEVTSGLVARETADYLKVSYPWYNPIRYLENLETVGKVTGKQLSVSSNQMKRLSELGSEAATIKPLDQLALSTLQREALIARNDAARAIVKAAMNDPKLKAAIKRTTHAPASGYGTLSFMENGIKETYTVPKWLENEAKYLINVSPTTLEKVGSAINSVSRFGMTSANLAFFIPNFAVDTLTALLSQGVNPFRVGKRLAQNLAGLVKEDKVLAQLRRSKGSMSGFWGKSPDEIVREVQKNGQLAIKSDADWKRWLKNPIKLIEDIGHAVEMAPRTAAFETALKRGKSLEEAALDARRVTIDFSRAGTAIKQANALYLYLNAGVQGAVLPFRALRDSARARWFTAGFASTSVAAYAWNRQFPEYDDVPDYAKYGSFMFMLPSEEYDKYGNKVPHYITVIPNLREWSLFHGTMTYAMRKLDKRAPEDMQQFLGALLPNINPASQITETGGGLQPPTQLGSTITDLVRNHDSFRGYPIVPVDYQSLPEEEQYNEYTSETAKRLGQFIGYSPMKIDYFVKNTLGGLGQQVMSAIDSVIKSVAPEDVPQIVLDTARELKRIKEQEKPEDMSRLRNELLYSLPSDVREQVLSYERRPEAVIPVITPISRRIYRESGGQLYKTGQALAAKELGLDEKQTAEASKVLGKFSAIMQTEQENLDTQLLNGELTPVEWREARSEQSTVYNGVLIGLGIIYPSAAQVQADPLAYDKYMDAVYTLASAMPDRRSRSQLLVSAYRAISPEEVDGKIDWDKFWAQRDEFRDNLIPEDKAELDSQLKQRMTGLEKLYYDFQKNEKLSVYYDLPEGYVKGVGSPREIYRKGNPEFDALLNLWGYVTTVKTGEALKLLAKYAEQAGIDYKKLPAFLNLQQQQGTTTNTGKVRNVKRL